MNDLGLRGVRIRFVLALGLASFGLSPVAEGRLDHDAGIVGGEVRLGRPDGDAVASVDVWASDSMSGIEVARDRTGRDGRFTLKVPPGRYLLLAERAGFLQSEYGSVHDSLPGLPVILTADVRLDLSIVIHRAPVVTGTVRDSSGRPIQDAQVEFLPKSSGWIPRSLRKLSTTDMDGVYTAEGLFPGDYVAAAMPASPPVLGSEADSVSGMKAQFYVSANREEQATTLTLRADEEMNGVNFILPRTSLATFAGHLVPPEGIQLRDDFQAIVSGRPGDPPTWAAARVLPGSRFHFSASPGRYQINVRAVGFGAARSEGRIFFASADLEINERDRIARELRLVEGVSISGHLSGDRSGVSQVGLMFVPVAGGQPAIRTVFATAESNGRFTTEALGLGRYNLQLSDSDADWAIDWVSVQGVRQPDLVVDTRGGNNETSVDVRLISTTASLSGVVLGPAETVTSTVVVLIPNDAAAPTIRRSQLARPDSRGFYYFGRQRPGGYKLVLLRNPKPEDIENQTFIQGVRSDSNFAIPVVLNTGVETKMDLRSR